MQEVLGFDGLIMGLKQLLDGDRLSPNDRKLAQKCLRRLEQPLRLTVFGTDSAQAVWLLNLMVGQTLVSPTLTRARVQFVRSDEPFAQLEFSDGSRKRLQSDQFRSIFDHNPTRVRIGVDLPVLHKVSFMVVAESDTEALCADAEKTLWPSDVAIWAGSKPDERMKEVWANCPDLLRDHSYLAISPNDDLAAWGDMASEFIDTLVVDPRLALEAKNAVGGADKQMFRQAGGTDVVKAVKKEIDMLMRASTDTAEMILARFKEDAASEEPNDPVTVAAHAYRLRRASRMPFLRPNSAPVSEPRHSKVKTVGRRSSRMKGKATPWSLGL